MHSTSDSQQRVVFITGGASGIGAAAAEAFKAEGAAVATLDKAGDQPVADLSLSGDVTNPADVAKAFAEAEAALGPIDVLVTAAGVSTPGTVADCTLEDWDQTFAVNVRGAFLCAREAIQSMRRSGSGAIVLVASQLGLVAAASSAAYCASKAAVIQLARAMAVDHAAEGIRVNCVCPGPTETPMLARRFAREDDQEAARARHLGLQVTSRFATPAEIAGGITYLASPIASSTVGAALVIDGGFTLR
jgi:NAD(P)-dependent dehydrogenase (short-subunit alcohol dehydrogenase family)